MKAAIQAQIDATRLKMRRLESQPEYADKVDQIDADTGLSNLAFLMLDWKQDMRLP